MWLRSDDGRVTIATVQGPEGKDWREMLDEIVDVAAEDPERFRVEVKLLAQSVGVAAEEVYAMIRERHPVVVDKQKTAVAIVDRLIKVGARKLRDSLKNG